MAEKKVPHEFDGKPFESVIVYDKRRPDVSSRQSHTQSY
jgi:hypothetical protein